MEIKDYPLMLDVDHVKEILGVNKTAAYTFCKQEGCPSIRVGKRIKIPRDRFFEYINTISELPENEKGDMNGKKT